MYCFNETRCSHRQSLILPFLIKSVHRWPQRLWFHAAFSQMYDVKEYAVSLIASKSDSCSWEETNSLFHFSFFFFSPEIEKAQKDEEPEKDTETYLDLFTAKNVKLKERVLIPVKQYPKVRGLHLWLYIFCWFMGCLGLFFVALKALFQPVTLIPYKNRLLKTYLPSICWLSLSRQALMRLELSL